MRLDPTIELLLTNFIRNRQYGEVVFKFEAGNLVLAKVTETIKPSSLEVKDNFDEVQRKR